MSDIASTPRSDNTRGPFPDVLEVVVEIPSGSRNKYEFDESAGVLRLDRVLSSAVFYNFEYGFVEGSRADEGDPIDPMILREDKQVEIRGWADLNAALDLLRADRDRWLVERARVADQAQT